MKSKISIILTALCGFVLASCASTPGGASTAGAKPYPKSTCIVSGNKLGSMGPVITQVHQGQEIKFCCKPCTEKFAANPAKYMARL